MEPRINLYTVAPEAIQALLGVENYIHSTNLENNLLELVHTRASQINGCAYCLDMHTKDARSRGETEQRLYALSAWRETPFFTDRERAALAWTETVTLVSEKHVPDEIYNEVKAHFTEKELVDLTLAVISINSFNRLAISMRAVPGTYEPPKASV
jgi:AhpD family alkylhydroperoxidase